MNTRKHINRQTRQIRIYAEMKVILPLLFVLTLAARWEKKRVEKKVGKIDHSKWKSAILSMFDMCNSLPLSLGCPANSYDNSFFLFRV